MQKPALNELYVLIRSVEANLYDGKAQVVSCFNAAGPFDILPQHENFITIIKDKIIVYKQFDSFTSKGRDKEEFPIDNAILKVFENVVYIFTGVANI